MFLSTGRPQSAPLCKGSAMAKTTRPQLAGGPAGNIVDILRELKENPPPSANEPTRRAVSNLLGLMREQNPGPKNSGR